jgi:periplasmic protein CpxP/Spy
MDYLKRNKILIGAVVVLLLLNIGIITFMLLTRPPGPHGPRDQRRDQVSRFIEAELGLSSEQKEKYHRLQEELFAQNDSIMSVRAEAMEEMYKLVKGETPDPARMREKAVQIGAAETERSVSTWEHFRALRALCTADQRTKFDQIILDVLHQVREPEPRGIHGPEHQGIRGPEPQGEPGLPPLEPGGFPESGPPPGPPPGGPGPGPGPGGPVR